LADNEEELEKIEKMMSNPNFWQQDQEEVSRLSQERASLREKIDTWQTLHKEAEDAKILAEIALEEKDTSSLKEVSTDVAGIQRAIRGLEFQALLGDPDDKRNAILAINAGAGGTEAQDWVEMLFRMYTRWGEDKGMKVRS